MSIILSNFQPKTASNFLHHENICSSFRCCYIFLSLIFLVRSLNCSHTPSWAFMFHMKPKICRFLLLPSPPPGDSTDKHTSSLRRRTNPTSLCLKCSFHSAQKAGFVSASGLCCGLFGGRTQRTAAGDKPASKQLLYLFESV